MYDHIKIVLVNGGVNMKSMRRWFSVLLMIGILVCFGLTSMAASKSGSGGGISGNLTRTTTTASANSSGNKGVYVKLYVSVRNTSTGITETMLKGENSGNGYTTTSCRAASNETYSTASSYHGSSKTLLYFNLTV